MWKRKSVLAFSITSFVLSATLVLSAARPVGGGPRDDEVQLEIAQIYWEYNDSAEDLGVHVSLDGEDWEKLAIENPDGNTIFQVRGRGLYGELGMTELFFEGAEPELSEVPLEDLLEGFPEGPYEFSGITVDGKEIEGVGLLTHAIPDGPAVSTEVGAAGHLRILWDEVTSPPPGFPNLPIQIVGYQVIVEPSYQVTLPATARSVTVSPEFVLSLGAGEHKFEVLAIEASGNQTLTEGSFDL